MGGVGKKDDVEAMNPVKASGCEVMSIEMSEQREAVHWREVKLPSEEKKAALLITDFLQFQRKWSCRQLIFNAAVR